MEVLPELHDASDNDISAAVEEVKQSQVPALLKAKVGIRIQGIHSQTGELVSGRLISRAGKSTGKYGQCFNLQKDSDGSIDWVDMDKDFTEWKMIPNEEEVLVLFNSDKVKAAKDSEMQNWIDNKVFSEVENIGQKTISVRWVVTEKIK